MMMLQAGAIMASWRGLQVRHANADHDDLMRDQVLGDLYAAKQVATIGRRVIVQAPAGTGVLERRDDIVLVEYHERGAGHVVQFWMNASSVADLGDKLRQVQRVAPNAIEG